MNQRPITLVCFAIKEEAKPFQERLGSRSDVRTLLTGIGQRNAAKTIRAALAAQKSRLVLSCGFAGGLRPDLEAGTVLFSIDGGTDLEVGLRQAGAQPARFYCIDRVLATAAEKSALWETTGADAVEMESQIICKICREEKIPSATVRVILDRANEDLPLDFNQLMTDDRRMDYSKLALALMRSPGKFPALRRLQKQTQMAAEKLAKVLVQVIPPNAVADL